MTRAEHLSATGLVLGEGPIRTANGFSCVDIRTGTVLDGTLDGEVSVRQQVDGTVSALCRTATDALLAAVDTHVEILGTDRRIQLPSTAPSLRLNDGKADPAGRFVVGTMFDPPSVGGGSLWSFDAGRATELLDGVTISNGLAWSADGETLFYIDTPTQRIDAFDYDVADGSIAQRRTTVTIPATAGSPDGMAIDAEGGLWVALWGGSAVHRYLDGRLDHVVDVPTPYVTCVAFIGDSLDAMLITTASEPNAGEPGAGDLYTASPGVIGAPTFEAGADVVFGAE